MRILVAEDDRSLGPALQRGLTLEGFAVDLVADGSDALAAVDITPFDVVVLDRDLPGTHGDQVCKEIAARPDGPAILMLTAAATLSQRVEGLELGADDYLPKPFDLAELVARIRALGRRPSTAVPPLLVVRDIEFDLFRRVVRRAGATIRLTTKEMAVLEVLMKASDGIVSAEQLLDRAWDENANPFTNSVRVTVSSLRKKLGSPDPIQTVQGSGYRFLRQAP